MKMQKITAIQYSTFKGPESEAVSYWGNIVIDDSFMVQFHGDSEECTYSVPSSEEACWNSDAAQDEARDKYSKSELVDFVESQGFENNLFYVEENGEKI
jgi:hypothetical protein